MNFLYCFVFLSIFCPIYTPIPPVIGIIAIILEVSLSLNPNGLKKKEILTRRPPTKDPKRSEDPLTKSK